LASSGKEQQFKVNATLTSLQLSNLDFHTIHIPGVQNEGTDMLSRDLTPGSPVDEDQLKERLVGVPTLPPTNTTNSPADDILATTETVNVLADDPFSNTTLASWQSNDPQTWDIIKAIKLDTPAYNTKSATKDTDTLVLSDDLLRQNVKGHLSIVIPKTQSQQVIRRYHDHIKASHSGWNETYWAMKSELAKEYS
jgi:hypothetical protein